MYILLYTKSTYEKYIFKKYLVHYIIKEYVYIQYTPKFRNTILSNLLLTFIRLISIIRSFQSLFIEDLQGLQFLHLLFKLSFVLLVNVY